MLLSKTLIGKLRIDMIELMMQAMIEMLANYGLIMI